MPQVRILSPRCDQKPVPSWYLSRPARGGFFYCFHSGVRKVTERQAQTYLQQAREIIKADYSVERSDFLGSRLALPDEIIEASIRCKQHSNAVGALKLQAQLTRLLEGS